MKKIYLIIYYERDFDKQYEKGDLISILPTRVISRDNTTVASCVQFVV